MKKVKKLVSFVLALSVVFSLAVTSASAATPNYDDGISICSATPSAMWTISGNSSSITTMSVSSAMPYWKIYVSNDSSYPLKVYVCTYNYPKEIVSGKGANGETITTLTIAPHSSAWYYTDDAQDAGLYLINANGGGTAMNATLWYKLADSVEDVNYQL